jgi:hypothetical protein
MLGTIALIGIIGFIVYYLTGLPFELGTGFTENRGSDLTEEEREFFKE